MPFSYLLDGRHITVEIAGFDGDNPVTTDGTIITGLPHLSQLRKLFDAEYAPVAAAA